MFAALLYGGLTRGHIKTIGLLAIWKTCLPSVSLFSHNTINNSLFMGYGMEFPLYSTLYRTVISFPVIMQIIKGGIEFQSS